jgi:hypothetical protein
VVVVASRFARTTVNRRAVDATARAEDANVVRVALRHRTSRTVSLTFIHARSRRRRVDHHRPRRRVATTHSMPIHRARVRIYNLQFARVSSPPLPRVSSPRLAHARSGRYSARAHVALAVVCQSHARVFARARDDDVESCQRWHIASSRVYLVEKKQHMLQCIRSLRTNVPCFPARWSSHERRVRERNIADRSFGTGRDSIESPPPTAVRDAREGTIGRRCARCGRR